MRLAKLTAQQYRSFDNLDLELRPLTLLYGDNSAGKSALLRLLPLIAGSLSSTPGMLDMRHPAGHGSDFEHLIGARWSNNDPYIRVGLGWDDGLAIQWELSSSPAMREVRASSRTENLHLRDTKHPLGREPGTQPVEEWDFDGLRPRTNEGLLGELSKRLGQLIGRVQYLGPTRAQLRSTPEGQWAETQPIEADGSNALRALSKDPRVEEEVRSFLDRHCERALIRENSGDSERWRLAPKAKQEWRVPISEAGVGIGQLLPELVSLSLRKTSRRGRGFTGFALEEPATHLHDRLQIAFAEHLADIAAEADPATTLIETHSRPLLTGIQRAIAQGVLPPDRVILHWIDQDKQGLSKVEPITFDAHGLPEGDRLSETFQAETQALADLADLALRSR